MGIYEKIKRTIKGVKQLWALIKPFKMHFFLCLSLIVMSSVVLGSFFSLLIPLVSSLVSKVESGNNNSGVIKYVFDLYLSIPHDKRQLVFAVFSIAALLINNIFRFASIYADTSFSAKIVTHTRKMLTNIILNLKYSFTASFNEGLLIQLVITEVRGVYAVVKQLFSMLVVVTQVMILSSILLVISYKITLYLIFLAVVLLAVNYFLVKRIKMLSNIGIELRFKLIDFVKEVIVNLRQVKINVLESEMKKRLNAYSDKTEWNMRKVRIITESMPLVTQMGIIIAIVSIVYASMKMDIFPKVMSPVGGLLNYILVLSSMIPYIGQFNKAIGTLYSNIPSVGRTFRFLYSSKVLRNIENYEKGKAEFRFNDSLSFENVMFYYSESKKDTPVLKNVSFNFKKGDKIAIIGKSGVGKTTLLNLIFGLFDPRDGKILIDNKNIDCINLIQLRKNIGYVSQDIKLFNTSIFENLMLIKPDANYDEIKNACVKADADSFINEFPEKYDTNVGERGEKLSGGQRQRIAIAQMFLKNPEIIILDEAVSAVDFESASNIRSRIFKEFKEKTIMIVSHQMSSIFDVGKIIIIENGEIKEFGDKEELLKNQDSIFYKMYSSQKL